MIIKDIDNFTLTGPRIGQSTIICTSPVSIVVRNANNIKFENIDLINCLQYHKVDFNTSYFDRYYARYYRPFANVTEYYTLLFLCNSSSVIYNMNINATVNTSFAGITIVNVKDTSLVNIKVQVNSLNCTTSNNHPIELNGLKVFVYSYDRISIHGSLTIDNFYYNNYNTCKHHLLCVIVIMLLLNDEQDVRSRFRLEILNCSEI